jgi:hypothetical protein
MKQSARQEERGANRGRKAPIIRRNWSISKNL